MKRKSKYQGHFREKMVGANLYETDIEAVSELRTEQSILSRLRRSSTVIIGNSIGVIRIGRVQSNLKLGGNTDLKVRPKLIALST